MYMIANTGQTNCVFPLIGTPL